MLRIWRHVAAAAWLCAGTAALAAEFPVYVASESGAKLDVISSATDTVATTISLAGLRAPRHLAVSPDGEFAYVVLWNELAVIDMRKGLIVALIPMWNWDYGGPGRVAVTPDGAFAYVGNTHEPYVAVVDTATNRQVRAFAVPASTDNGIEAIAFTPDSAHAYLIANEENDDRPLGVVTITETGQSDPADAIRLDVGVRDLATSPDGERVYITTSSGLLLAMSARTKVVEWSVELAGWPSGIVLSPRGDRAFVASTVPVTGGGTAGRLSIVDTVAGSLLDTVPLASGPRAIAITPDGGRVYAALDGADGAVAVLDTAAMTIVDVIPIGSDAVDIAIPSGERPYFPTLPDPAPAPTPEASTSGLPFRVYALDSAARKLVALEAPANTTAYSLESALPVHPNSVAVSRDGALSYVAGAYEAGDRLHAAIRVIENRTGEVVETIDLPEDVPELPFKQIAVSPDATVVAALDSLVSLYLIHTASKPATAEPVAHTCEHRGATTPHPVFSPDGTLLYLATSTETADDRSIGELCIIDTVRREQVAMVTLPRPADDLAVSPDGLRLYAVNRYGSVTVLDARSHAIAAVIPLDATLTGIAVKDDRFAYISATDRQTGGSPSVLLLDTLVGRIAGSIPLGANASEMVFTPNGALVYGTLLADGRTFAIVDVASGSIVASTAVAGPSTFSVAPAPDAHAVPPARQTGGGCQTTASSSYQGLTILATLWLWGFAARRRRSHPQAGRSDTAQQ